MLFRISALWARAELWCAAALALVVTLLILLNVVTRSMGNALFWWMKRRSMPWPG